MKDYYKILGVEKGAGKDEIKKAFHKLAHKYHPDKSGGDEAKFKEINEAYQILSDDSKRAQYDRFGSSGGHDGGFSAQGGPASGWDFSGFNGNGGQGFDFGDIFSEFFGGQGFGGGERARRGRDISVDIQISFSESIFGTQRKVVITKVGVCDTCKGSGAESGTKFTKCEKCGGKGKINETRRSILGTFTTVKECETCHGKGEIPEKKCKTCGGPGVLKKNEEIAISVPPGISNGEMIRLSGRGEAASGGVSGDLYVKIHIERHPVFQREGVNLVMDLSVKLTDALAGADYKIDTLDGPLTLKIPEGIGFGEILRVRGKGVPMRGDKRGDLLVRVVIKIPNKLSRKAKKLIDELKEEGV